LLGIVASPPKFWPIPYRINWISANLFLYCLYTFEKISY
jgi:hypothetical protein